MKPEVRSTTERGAGAEQMVFLTEQEAPPSESGRRRRCNMKSRIVVPVVGLLSVLLGIALALVLLLRHPNAMYSHPMLINCTGDKYNQIQIGNQTIKYNFVAGIDDYYNLYSAQKECEKQEAELWQDLSGEAEYEALRRVAQLTGKTKVWLNAEAVVDPSCLGTSTQCGGSNQTQLRWRQSGQTIPFRRPMKEADKDQKCLYVMVQEDSWKWAYCLGESGIWGLCVKRHCLPEPQSGP